jgi:hypothetical protein
VIGMSRHVGVIRLEGVVCEERLGGLLKHYRRAA